MRCYNTEKEREHYLQEVETLAILTGLEIDSAKSGIKPDLSEYIEHSKASKKIYTYSREEKKQKILVICSFSEQKENFKVPKGFDLSKAELALCNYGATDGTTLQPYEARVYLWK